MLKENPGLKIIAVLRKDIYMGSITDNGSHYPMTEDDFCLPIRNAILEAFESGKRSRDSAYVISDGSFSTSLYQRPRGLWGIRRLDFLCGDLGEEVACLFPNMPLPESIRNQRSVVERPQEYFLRIKEVFNEIRRRKGLPEEDEERLPRRVYHEVRGAESIIIKGLPEDPCGNAVIKKAEEQIDCLNHALENRGIRLEPDEINGYTLYLPKPGSGSSSKKLNHPISEDFLL